MCGLKKVDLIYLKIKEWQIKNIIINIKKLPFKMILKNNLDSENDLFDYIKL
jgi:hypothetical protein